MNSCDFYQELISRMLDDELSNKERAVLAEHLYVCDECAAMYSAFSTVSDMVAADLAEPPEELAEDVMAHIRRAEMRKRNRKNTRATKNALVAAACAVLVISAVGGTAVIRSQRSDSVVYESQMGRNQAAASGARDGSYDTVIVSEAPVISEQPQNDTRYVAPVEDYTAPAQPQEEKPFFVSILPESWFSAETPAPTQPPVQATPAATPFAQHSAVPYAAGAQPPVVVVSPANVTPVAEAPVVTEAPVAETPVVTEAPVAETPVVTEAPVNEEFVFALPFASDIPVTEMAPMENEGTGEMPLTDAPSFELSSEVQAQMEQPAPEGSLPGEAPAVSEYDFSSIDCSEFIMALFSSKPDETQTETAISEEAATQDGSASGGEYVSVVDKLLALNSVKLSPLPENVEADRVEKLSFAQEGQFFTVEVSIFGENVYVLSYCAEGQPVSFRSRLSAAEYDGMLKICHEINAFG